MSEPALSPSLTPKDSEITHEQLSSPVAAPSDHSDDTESAHEELSSPVTAPSDLSDDAAGAAGSAGSTVSTSKGRDDDPPSKVRELASWFDAKANGNLRLQVLTWDGRVMEVPKNKCKKSREAEQGLT